MIFQAYGLMAKNVCFNWFPERSSLQWDTISPYYAPYGACGEFVVLSGRASPIPMIFQAYGLIAIVDVSPSL